MKDFNSWNQEKIKIEESVNPIPYFAEGDIWWVKLGLNIGIETDGKGRQYTRPLLIIKKYNQYSFLCTPLSTNVKLHKYKILLGTIDGKSSAINLSQLRNIDSKRLARKICHISQKQLVDIKRKASEVNFS